MTSYSTIAVWAIVLAVAAAAGAPVLAAEAPAPADKAADDFNMAAWLYADRKYDLAAEEFRNFLRKHPDHEKAADARLGLAQALLHAGKNDEAVAALQELRQKYPKFERLPEALYYLGQAQAAAGKAREAADTFDLVVRNHAGHYLADWSRARQGEALLALKDFAAAETALSPLAEKYLRGAGAEKRLRAERERLDKTAPGLAANFDALLERAHLNLGLARFGAGRWDPARQTFEEFLAASPKSPLAETARFYLAQSLLKAGQFDRAAEVYANVAQGKGDLAPDAAFERALAMYQAKKYKDAAAAFADCAKRFPKSPRAARAAVYAGTCLYLAGDFRGAAERLKSLDTDAEALYWLGLAHQKLGKPAEARAALEKSAALAPDGPRAADVLLARADALMAEGKADEAAAAYQQFVAKFAGHADYPLALYAAAAALHKAGKYAPSEEICGRFLEKPAADLLPQALFISGENRFLLKNPAGAAERFKPLVEKYPDAPEAPAARLRLAWIDYGAKNYDGALAHIERIDLKKADKAVQAEAEYLRGNCLLEKKDHERAAEALGRYLSAPDAARYREDALLKLATALARAGKPGDAATRLQQLLKDHGGSPLAAEAEYNLADLLAGPLKKPDEAAAHYKALAERFPDHRLAPYALMGLGSVRLQKGENEPAAEAFARAAEKYPRSDLVPQALYQKGVALEKAGKAAEARAAWQALVEKFPQHDLAPAATLGMAVALQKEKKFDEAAAAFRKLAAGTKDPRTREQASYELAWCLQEAGKTKEAAQAWKSLADKYPGGASAADAAFHLAEAEYANKRYAEAAALFEKSLAAARDGRLKDKALYRLGWCRWSQGDFAGAAAAFDRLVAEAPASDLVPEAILQAGEALTRAGKPAEAINRLKRLLDPKYRPFDRAADARFRLGEAQLILGRNDEAMATFADLEQNWPKYPAMAEVQFNLGKALFDLKRHPEARARFEKALQGADTETAAKAQFYVGEALLAAGDPREALKAYLRVVALWSAYREWAGAAQFESGKCYQALGKPAEAREAFKTVVDKYNDTKWADPAREQLKK